MTTLSKDEIVRLAREALLNDFGVAWQIEALERFATICRADLVAENERLIAERHLYAQSIAGMNEAMDALKADAEQWRAYKSRKDAVIAAGMGRNPLRKEAK